MTGRIYNRQRSPPPRWLIVVHVWGRGHRTSHAPWGLTVSRSSPLPPPSPEQTVLSFVRQRVPSGRLALCVAAVPFSSPSAAYLLYRARGGPRFHNLADAPCPLKEDVLRSRFRVPHLTGVSIGPCLRHARPATMNGGRVAKRLLAIVLALSTMVTLGLYYNGLSSGGGSGTGGVSGGNGGGRMMDDRSGPRPAALSQAEWLPRHRPAAAFADNDLSDDDHREIAAGQSKRRRPGSKPPRPAWSAAVDRDTCPELGLANTTIDTVTQFSRFEFRVSVVFFVVYI